MANLTALSLSTLKSWLINHKRIAAEAILTLLLGLFVWNGISLHNQNKKLSEELEMANNNIEVYQGIANGALEANGVLKMNIKELENSKDTVILKVDSVMKANDIKPKEVTTAATQTQTLLVSAGKGVGGYIEVLKDTIYTDSLQYNDLTKVYYSIGNDSINMTLDVKNTQYLYTYKTREYKNKKGFFKRLFTWDWKKVDRYKYEIINTNDLLKESDIRIIEQE